MINTEKMNTLLREVEGLVCVFIFGLLINNRILTQIGEATLAGEEFELEYLREKFDDADSFTHLAEECLAEVKIELTQMVDAIKFWSA